MQALPSKVFSVKVKGVAALKRQLSTYVSQAAKRVDNDLNKGADSIASDARGYLSYDPASISNTIFTGKPQPGRFTIEATSPVAAYHEFGTGNYAATYVTTIPQEWRDYAKTFFINGLGRTPATPFLYPAYEQNRQMIIDNVANDLV